MPVSKNRRKSGKVASGKGGPARSGFSRSWIYLGVAVAVAVGAYFYFTAGGPQVDVTVPKLTAAAQQGATAFANKCVSCHGQNAAGSGSGPPLVHRIYEPNHHGDGSFHRAVRRGVRAHHWSYGNMPPIGGVSDRDIRQITAYLRELQFANGIR